MVERSEITERSEIAERLAIVAGALSRRLRPGAGTALLTHVELSVLATVARAGSIRPGDVARLEGMAAPGATRILTELEHRRLVHREPDPADGRSILIATTPAGSAAIVEARKARTETVESLLVGIADPDLAVIGHAVQVLQSALLGASLPDGRVRIKEFAAN